MNDDVPWLPVAIIVASILAVIFMIRGCHSDLVEANRARTEEARKLPKDAQAWIVECALVQYLTNCTDDAIRMNRDGMFDAVRP